MSKRSNDSRHRGEGQSPGLLPLVNKNLFLLLIIMTVHIFHWDAVLLTKGASMVPGGNLAAGSADNGPSREQPPANQGKPAPDAHPATSGEPADSRKATAEQPDNQSVQWAVLKGETQIRTEPDPNKPVLLAGKAGDGFPLIKRDGDWLQVQVNANQKGWVAAGQVSAQSVDRLQVQLVRVKPETRLYRGPDESFGEAGGRSGVEAWVPEQVSGEWVRLSDPVRHQTLWIKADQAAWTYGYPPAKETMANEVAIQSAKPEEPPLPLKGKTIVVDPGHGGKDPGAIAGIRPVNERDVNLAAALVLAEKLKAAGANVVMTRTSNDQNVSLVQRAKLSNDNQADVFVSIHQNMYTKDPSVNGTITFYQSDSSKPLAQEIEAAVTRSLGSREEGEQTEKEQLYVLTHNSRPAVLVEGCFLSNPQELAESLLPEYYEKLSAGIYRGILAYLKADA
jgi:N-acetylmuramoyl-L-alanine amidase